MALIQDTADKKKHPSMPRRGPDTLFAVTISVRENTAAKKNKDDFRSASGKRKGRPHDSITFMVSQKGLLIKIPQGLQDKSKRGAYWEGGYNRTRKSSRDP